MAAQAAGPVNPGGSPNSQEYARALINILDDFAGEKVHLHGTQAAVLNILEDFTGEKQQLRSMQRAVINVLEDAHAEKLRLEATQAAVLNILDDLQVEKNNLEKARNQLLISAEELRASLREKEVLLQEVHHRVKNNLQVISSLISLQLRPIKDPVSREALQACPARVQSISLIHAMLYQSRDYANVPFSQYARELAGNIFHAVGTDPGRISLDLAIDEVMLPVDKAIPCGLILNELITNALKHGFPNDRRGSVRVELGRAGQDQLRLSVEDNGVGMAPGLETGQIGSLGMHLISALAEQLGAEFEMSGDHGTSFRFTFASGAADLPGPDAIAPGRKFVADSQSSASRAEAPILQTS
jgi:two-component sensor histidine kinase